MPPLSGLEGIGQDLGLSGGLGLTGGVGLTGGLATGGAGSAVGPVGAARAAEGAASFGESVTGAVDELRQLQSTSNELAVAAVTGNLDDIHSAMIASARASVTLELVAAVRNKGVDAFNEIMRMQA